MRDAGTAHRYDHPETNGWCQHAGSEWHPTQTVRPREAGGTSENEGLFLNLNNGYHDGQGFQGDEPVYYEYKPGVRIQYWFTFRSA